jgi:hypothetical protein
MADVIEAEMMCGWCDQVVPEEEGQVMENGIVTHDECVVAYALGA